MGNFHKSFVSSHAKRAHVIRGEINHHELINYFIWYISDRFNFHDSSLTTTEKYFGITLWFYFQAALILGLEALYSKYCHWNTNIV